MRFPWRRKFACANIIPQRPAHHTKPALLSLKDVFLWIINNNGNLNNHSFYMLNTCYVPGPLLSTLYTLSHLILRKQESAVNDGAQGHWTWKHSCPHSLLEDMPWLLGLLDLWSPRGRSGQRPSEQATQDRPERPATAVRHGGKPVPHSVGISLGLMEKIKSERTERTPQGPAEETRWKYPEILAVAFSAVDWLGILLFICILSYSC